MPSLSDSRITNRWVVRSSHANHLGTAHGGSIVKWMDEVGGMAAVAFAGKWCVTAHMGSVDFDRPIEVDDTVLVTGYVYEAGETSVRVRVTAEREDLRTGETESAAEAHVVYVAVDENGEPSPVPELDIESKGDEEFKKEALESAPECE